MTTDPTWRKSTYSASDGSCVEVKFLDGGNVAVRDSKDPTGPALVFTPAEWDAFTAAMLAGEFTRPGAYVEGELG